MGLRTEIETITQYKTADGKLFPTEAEARRYVREMVFPEMVTEDELGRDLPYAEGREGLARWLAHHARIKLVDLD